MLKIKGTNNVSPIRLKTDHEMFPGKKYLVLGYCDDGVFTAYEEYRIVPLDKFFSTDLIAGKPIDEQVKIFLQRRLDNLKLEIQNNEKEKQRLEEGLKTGGKQAHRSY